MEKVKFVSVTRTICPKTQLHYLDAISDDGEYYTAVMSPTKRIGWSILPSGKTIIVFGIRKWAKENGYNHSHIGKVASGKAKRHKDIVAVEKLSHRCPTKHPDAL